MTSDRAMMSLRANALLMAALLASLAILSFSPESPLPLAELHGLEDGTRVTTAGVVAEIVRYSTGTERLVLVDGFETATVVALATETDAPSTRLDPGDTAEVRGTLSTRDGQLVIFSSYSDVRLLGNRSS